MRIPSLSAMTPASAVQRARGVFYGWRLVGVGMSLSTAGIVVLTYTAVALPSQFFAGVIADKLPKPVVLFVFLSLQASAIMVIAFAEDVRMAFLFAVIYGGGFGGRIPLLTAIRGEYFGRKAFATIMGLSQMPNNIAMMFAPLFAAYMIRHHGDLRDPVRLVFDPEFLGSGTRAVGAKAQVHQPASGIGISQSAVSYQPSADGIRLTSNCQTYDFGPIP